MEQTRKCKGNLMKYLGKVLDGFFEYIGAAIAIAIATFLGSYFGGQRASKTIVEELSRRDTVYVVNSEKDFKEAKKYELAGFRALIDKDIDLAIQYFMTSENCANGYRASYDIAQYLRKNKNSESESGFWEKTYIFIIENYRFAIPEDVLVEMKKNIKSH